MIVGRYVRLVMRGAVAKLYKASRAAARVGVVDAGEYALRRVWGGSVVDGGGVVLGTADNHNPRGRSGTATRAVVALYGSTTTTTPPTKLWYYMAAGGRGGPVVIPHPDDKDAGSTNANNNNNAPPPPPKTTAMPRGGRATGRRRCRTTMRRRRRRAGTWSRRT